MDIIKKIKEEQNDKDDHISRIKAAITMQCFETKGGITINLENINKYRQDMSLDKYKRKEWQRIYDIFYNVPGVDYLTPIDL